MMRQRKGAAIGWLLGVSLAAAGCTTAPGSGGSTAGSGGWSAAQSVPGVTFQAVGQVYTAPSYVAASCSSPQDCTVVYAPTNKAVFSVTRRGGTWGAPRQVPGLGRAQGMALKLACTRAGDCLLAASAPVSFGDDEVSVARLTHGTWSAATPLPGLDALYPGYSSQVSAVACGQQGWCALVGGSEPPDKFGRDGKAFVASEHDGNWAQAQAVPGLGALTGSWAAGVDLVSCDSGDTCTAAGDYRDHAVRNDEPYVVTATAGRWGRARPIAGGASLGASEITALACPAPGDCSATGTASANDTRIPPQLFTVSRTGGSWHRATPLRGSIPLPYSADTKNITALTCTAPGQCTALGVYATSANSTDIVPVEALPFEAVQTRGRWSAIHAIPGLPAKPVAWVTSVSCASTGTCAAGGFWLNNANGDEHSISSNHAFVATETRGRWKAVTVPGLAALGSGDSTVDTISCQPHRGCIAVGDFTVHGRSLFTTSRR